MSIDAEDRESIEAELGYRVGSEREARDETHPPHPHGNTAMTHRGPDENPKKGDTVMFCHHVKSVVLVIDGKSYYDAITSDGTDTAWWRRSATASPVVTVLTGAGELSADWFACCDACNEVGRVASGPASLPADVEMDPSRYRARPMAPKATP